MGEKVQMLPEAMKENNNKNNTCQMNNPYCEFGFIIIIKEHLTVGSG